MAVLLFLSYMLSMVLVLWEVGAILGDKVWNSRTKLGKVRKVGGW